MKMPLPTNAKMTALVCNGRRRPNVRPIVSLPTPMPPIFHWGNTMSKAIQRPTNIPTTPDDGSESEISDDLIVILKFFQCLH